MVVQVEATRTKPIEYSGITFTLTEGKIEKFFKGEYEANDVISILETGGISEVHSNNKVQRVNYIFEENEVFKTGDKAIIFLKKYSGPIAENSYVVLGVYQGKFLINGEKIIAPEHGIEGISGIEDLKLN
ncbi:hypothetical protein EBB07_16285 [Paenibacillaceae bacterium]|nr:hypothetical protein EBB07_16285 [Paenibacillaceae bacterium]